MVFAGLLVFVAIVSLGLTGAGTLWSTTVRRDREEELRFRLRAYKRAIDRYRLFHKRPPRRLSQLAEKGRGTLPFIRRLYGDPTLEGAGFLPVIDREARGIVNVRSGNGELTLNGTPYSSWRCDAAYRIQYPR